MEDSLIVGDYITSVDNCVVKNAEDWKLCIKQTLMEPQHGFCTDMMTMTRKNSFLGMEVLTPNLCSDNLSQVFTNTCLLCFYASSDYLKE